MHGEPARRATLTCKKANGGFLHTGSKGNVLVIFPDQSVRAALFFASNTDESCITTAALSSNPILVPRAAPPNKPVFPSGVTARDLSDIGAVCATFTHYAVADLDVSVPSSPTSTLLSSVPLRVINSNFAAVLLGNNDAADVPLASSSSSSFPPPAPSQPDGPSGSPSHPACSSQHTQHPHLEPAFILVGTIQRGDRPQGISRSSSSSSVEDHDPHPSESTSVPS